MRNKLRNPISVGLALGALGTVCNACDPDAMVNHAPGSPVAPSTPSTPSTPQTAPIVLPPTPSEPTSATPGGGLELLSWVHSVNGIPVRVVKQDQHVYLADWNNQRNGGTLDGSVQTYTVAEVLRPSRLSSLFTPDQEVHDLALDGRWLFVANDAWGLRMLDVERPDALSSVASRANRGLFATSVAVVAAGASGRRYVLVGYLYGGGMDIHAVPDGGPIAEPAHYASSSFPGRCDVHRIEVRGDRAYVLASDGSTRACIEVLDLSRLPAVPTALGRYCFAYAEYGDIGDLRLAGDLVYYSAADYRRTFHAGGLRIVSLADEKQPTLVGSLDLPNVGTIEWRGAGLALGPVPEVFFLTSKGIQIIDASSAAQPTAQEFAAFPDAFGECQGGTALF